MCEGVRGVCVTGVWDVHVKESGVYVWGCTCEGAGPKTCNPGNTESHSLNPGTVPDAVPIPVPSVSSKQPPSSTEGSTPMDLPEGESEVPV